MAPDALNQFLAYSWPGNVRELKHKLQELVIFNDVEKVRPAWVRKLLKPDSDTPPTTYPTNESTGKTDLRTARKEFERRYILQALNTHNWNIPATAKFLGIERTNLYRKMRELGIGR